MEEGPVGRHLERGARRRRLLTRALPLVVLAVIAFTVGVIVGSGSNSAERQLVTNYMRDWARARYGAMYSLLAPASRRQITEAQFVAAYQNAAQTSTLDGLKLIRAGDLQGTVIPARVRVHTRLFGALRGTIDVPLAGSGSNARVGYTGTLLFPGLRSGERLTRIDTLAPRAALFASNGAPLAQGPNRTSPLPNALTSEIVGVLGAIPAAEAGTYAAEGYPANASVGTDGLERIFQSKLAGTPGGELFAIGGAAGKRMLAHVAPIPGRDVKTTIVPSLETAAINAIAGRVAGLAVMNPRTGGVLALAGEAFSALQPPGSTMKIVTTTAALQAGVAKLSTTYPIATESDVGGYILHNAFNEACGGTLLNAFAVSCNSVFAPLGVQVGASRFVSMAKAFGFDQPPVFAGELESQIPAANQIQGDTELGVSAIGQGRVLATALEMADVGATIADGGRRPVPTLESGHRTRFVHVTSRHVASLVQRAMIAVVQFGTGTSAAIPGVTVAGKTGTAELGGNQNTDSWFVGYAPVGHARILAAAVFPAQGQGAAVAAPAVREVLVAGLQAH